MKDYYEILEVHPKASKEVIKKAYQTLAKLYHPDETAYEKGFAHEKLTELNEAYSVLSNSERREEYDRKFFGKLGKQEKTELIVVDKIEPGNEAKTEQPWENMESLEESKKELSAEDKKESNVAPAVEKSAEEPRWKKKLGDWIVKGVAVIMLLLVGAFTRAVVKGMFTSSNQTTGAQQSSKRLGAEDFKKNTERIADCTRKIENYKRAKVARSRNEPNKISPFELNAELDGVRNDNDLADVYKDRAWAYDELGEYEKAIVDYTKAIELAPIDGNTYYNRGVVYQHKGDRAKANADFKKAKELGYKP